MSTEIITRRCTQCPLSEAIIYDGPVSVLTVLSSANRADSLRFEVYTDTGMEVTVWEPPIAGMRLDARNQAGVAQRVRIIHRRSSALLGAYTLALGIETRDSVRTIWTPNLARAAQGLRIGTSVTCTHGAYVIAGSFVAWDTGSLRLVYNNNDGAFTVTPRVQLQAYDVVTPYDVSEIVALASLGGAGAWRRSEHVLGIGGTTPACPTVISGRGYYVRFQNNEAADKTVDFDVYIEPAGIAR